MRVRRARSFLALGVWLVTPAASLLALDPARPLRHIRHDVWTADEGLPQSSVLSLAQTRDGFLWLGTEEGLARFDGFGFRVWNAENTGALRSSMVQRLWAAHDGGLWIGTVDGGLVRLAEGTFTRWGAERGLPFQHVSALAEDRPGHLWVGSFGSGLAELVGGLDGRFRMWTEEHGLPDKVINALLPDGRGGLWIGTDRGLARLAAGRITPVLGPRDLPDCSVQALAADGRGGLWIATGAGLGHLVGDRFTLLTTRDGLPGPAVTALRLDREGSLWIGTDRGLARLVGGRLESLTPRDGLSAEIVSALLEDREGNLWVGTDAGGLDRLRDTPFVTLTQADGLPDVDIRAVMEDRQGGLWVGGSRGGAVRLAAGRVERWGLAEGLPSDEVYAFAEGRDGSLWMGLLDGGLVRLRNGRLTAYGRQDGLPSPHVVALLEDREEALWLGTNAGLVRYAAGRFTTFTERDGLASDFVLTLAEGSDGTLWIGTMNGLCRMRGGRIEREPAGRDLGLINFLYADPSGELWIGTQSCGLNRLVDGRLRAYTAAHGLPTNLVYAVLDDGRGHLWLSSSRGIVRVARRQLDALDKQERRALEATLYGRADGLASAECNGGGPSAAWRGRDGRLWFTTLKGLAAVDPGVLYRNLTPPPVAIDGLVADGVPVPTAADVKLAPGTGNLEIVYTGLSYRNPEAVRFRYRLAGFDPDWMEVGGRRTAFYTRIPPGRYRFQVAAANGDGVWNHAGAAFDLEILPRFYQTSWFYLACAAAAAGLVWLLYRLRLRQMTAGLRAAVAERTRIARELHDTLAQDLAAVALQLESVSETMETSPGEAGSYLRRARALVRESLERARRSVWGLRANELEGADLPGALAAVARSAGSEPGAPVDFAVEGKPEPLPLATEEELLRIAQEAVANARRHGAAARVRMILRYEPEQVVLVVEDDGRGFDVPAAAGATLGRFGLQGIRERAVRLGGSLTLASSPGLGTRVGVTLPAPWTKEGEAPRRAKGGR